MRALVTFCHPVPDSFGAHLRDRTLAALAEARLIDLYGGHDLPRPFEDLDADHLAWAEAVVLVYPTWWSSLPAPLMGWVEAGLERDMWRHLTRVVAVTTHGSSRLVNTVAGEVGKRLVRYALPAQMAPGARATFISLYRMDRIDDASRLRFAERLGRELKLALG